MAGIGFELKKLFAKRGILSNIQAYGYATVVCTGPMLLSILLLLTVRMVAARHGADVLEQELLVSLFTYTLLASLVVSNLFAMVTTRYTADMIFMEKKERVLPSMYGNMGISLVIGCVSYGLFLRFSGLELLHQIITFILFSELIIVWIQINYMTALKNYKAILMAFIVSVVVSVLSGYLLGALGVEIISAMVMGVIIGYGVMMVWYFILLNEYFPKGEGSAFGFLVWIDKFPGLNWSGIFLTVGLFGHLVIMWFSPISEQVKGLFYGAPTYDVPALFAFLSSLITTVNFITSVEVTFYPRYRKYFALFNGKGTLRELKRAESEMMTVLKQELFYLALRQVFTTLIFIVVIGPLLINVGMGFTRGMMGTYRMLCVGYGLYAIANSFLLILLYFADNKGAFISSMIFMITTNLGSILFMNSNYRFYGVGFTIGCFVMYLIAYCRLTYFTGRLEYYVLCSQPILKHENKGIFTKLASFLEDKVEKKFTRIKNGGREIGDEIKNK